MFPQTENISQTVTSAETKNGTRSFLFDFNKGDFVVNDGKPTECDGLSALKVWIEKILHTEKGRFEMYLETEYGCKLEDLIVGSNYPIAFIESELKREIEDALLQNPKISAITDFSLSRSASMLTVSLEVRTSDEGTNTVTVTF